MTTPQRGSNSRNSQQRTPLTAVTNDGDAPPPADMPLPASMGPDGREDRIALGAYLRAAERGFAPGNELEDWLAAERELEANGHIEPLRPL